MQCDAGMLLVKVKGANHVNALSYMLGYAHGFERMVKSALRMKAYSVVNN